MSSLMSTDSILVLRLNDVIPSRSKTTFFIRHTIHYLSVYDYWLQIQESNLLSLGYEPSEMTVSLICYIMRPPYLHVSTSTGASNYSI